MSRPCTSAELATVVIALIATTLLYSSLQCPAQTSHNSESKSNESLQSHRILRVSAPVDFEQFAVYWTEEPGWHTDLQLRNNLAAKELVVIPALRSPDG